MSLSCVWRARGRVAGVVARDAVLEYRYDDAAPGSDLNVSLLCKVHLGKGTSMWCSPNVTIIISVAHNDIACSCTIHHIIA